MTNNDFNIVLDIFGIALYKITKESGYRRLAIAGLYVPYFFRVGNTQIKGLEFAILII